jgi:Tol biopolymer transport system component
MRRLLLTSVAAVAAATVVAGSSGATFPGRDGRIVFTKPHAVDYAFGHVGIYSLDLASGRSRDLSGGTTSIAIGQLTLSPDGTRFAFLRPVVPPAGHLEWRLWLMGVEGSDQHQLVDFDVSGSFAWSPDGTSLAFIAPTSAAAPLQYDDALWVVNADGSGLRELTDVEAGYPSWSPDGSEIAFVGRDVSRSVFGSPIGVISATGAGLRWLSPCGTALDGCITTSPPAWSPDGKALVFARGGSLVLISADGSVERTLTTGVANGPVNCRYGGCDLEAASLQWFPRNDEISFVDKAGNVELVRPDGSSVQTIVCHASPLAAVAWSPSGDRLAFVRWLVNVKGPALSELVVEPLHGPARILPLPSGLRFSGLAGWLPSGEGLLLAADRGVHPLELFSMRARGGDPRQLTDNHLDDFDPVWSPDGRRIAFARGQVDYGYTAAERSLHPGSAAQSSLYLMGADGSHVRRLTGSGVDTMPSWSPDGAQIVFARRHGPGFDLDIVDTRTGRIRRLTSGASDPAWSPDGRLIAFARGNTLRIIRRDRSSERTLYRGGTSATAQILRPAWSPDGRSIAFTLATMRLDGSLAGQRLLTVPRIGGAPRALPCHAALRWYYSDSDIPRIASRAPDGAIGVSDGAAIWACASNGAPARFLRGGDEPDWQPLR